MWARDKDLPRKGYELGYQSQKQKDDSRQAKEIEYHPAGFGSFHVETLLLLVGSMRSLGL